MCLLSILCRFLCLPEGLSLLGKYAASCDAVSDLRKSARDNFVLAPPLLKVPTWPGRAGALTDLLALNVLSECKLCFFLFCLFVLVLDTVVQGAATGSASGVAVLAVRDWLSDRLDSLQGYSGNCTFVRFQVLVLFFPSGALTNGLVEPTE